MIYQIIEKLENDEIVFADELKSKAEQLKEDNL